MTLRDTLDPTSPPRSGHPVGLAQAALSLFIALSGCGGAVAPGPGDDGGGIPPLPGFDASAGGSDGGGAGDGGGGSGCAASRYFETEAWPRAFSTCAGCHVPGGPSGGTRFVLVPPNAPDALLQNFRVVATAARTLVQDGESLLVTKPAGRLPHGGGALVPDGDPRQAVLREMVRLARDPASTAGCDAAPVDPLAGLVLHGPRATLRKAAIELAGRLPTPEELALADAADPNTLAGLDGALLGLLVGPGFEDRLRELFNDLLLTDKYRFEGGNAHLAGQSVPRRLRAAAYCAPEIWQSYDERTNTAESKTCIAASEALAREPLEMIVHIVRDGRPFTEILTGQYRYFNAAVARLFGLDPAPWAGRENDSTFFVEARFPAMHGPGGLPEEYAGLLTTNAFLFRYNSTSSNRNRGRAWQYYRLFLDQDVMRTSARIDLSSVDLKKSPWRHDPQCTACHASIDPVAGAFQHWTNCYDISQVEYYTQRYCGGPWFPENDMFAPGTAAGDANRLGPNELPTALAHLGNKTARDPNFARAVAAHVYTGLTGHDRLYPPPDPGAPDYVARAAAYELQSRTIDALGTGFVAANFDLKRLILAVVKTPGFRAASAMLADRAELDELGGGPLLTPEVLDRKITSALGGRWTVRGGAAQANPSLRDPPFWLTSLFKFRLLAGGIDSDGMAKRRRDPGTISSGVLQRMALELACQMTAYDFALAPGQRRLFGGIERTQIPTGQWGDPRDLTLRTAISRLHGLLLGEEITPDSPVVKETYELLVELQKAGAASVLAGREPQQIPMACAARENWATAQALPQNQQFSDDADYVVRAWQGVIAYLLLDYRFSFAP